MTTASDSNAVRVPKWLIWPLVSINLLSILAYIWMEVLGCGIFFPITPTSLLQFGFVFNRLGFAALGALLIYHRPGNRIGWLSAAIGALQLITLLENYNLCGLSGILDLPGLTYTVWLVPRLFPIYLYFLLPLLPLIFPTGRFLSSRWLTLTLLLSGIFVLTILAMGLLPGEMGSSVVANPPKNPLGVGFLSEDLRQPLNDFASILSVGIFLISISSVVIRWRRARGDERQQLKWLAYFLSTVMFIPVIGILYRWIFDTEIFSTFWFGLINAIGLVGFPLIIGTAIFKYRLYDIDLIIRRTLSYAALTALLALVYFGGVVVMQSVFRALSGNPDSPLVTVISTLVIAALFNPLRVRVQDFIDRRFYRQEYDAQKALERFAATAREEVDMDRLTSTLLGVVEKTMQPERLSLWLKPMEDESE